MKRYQSLAKVLLRITLAAGFLSAVASRLSLWGSHSSGWESFLTYVGQINPFVPARFIPALAVAATVLEASFALLLLTGYKTKWVALGASLLTLFFALAMTFSQGIKEPLDYSVFAFSASAFLLSTLS